MEFCSKKLKEKNFKIVNLDINFICESPNINKISYLMKNNISKILKISTKIISVKATTNEKVGLIGSGKAIAAEAIPFPSDEATPPVINTYCITDNPDTE